MHFFIAPQIDSSEWISAVRGYALRFGITITSSLETVPQLAPNEAVIVSLIDGPVLYGFHDVAQWLNVRGIAARIDPIKVESPAELRSVAEYRVQAGDPLAMGSHGTILDVEPITLQGVRLVWPTTEYSVIQRFGDNPALALLWGLPGHDGLDIAASANSPVFAAAEGEVIRVHDGRGYHPYGIHICIQHPNGMRTLYAHLNKAEVSSGTMLTSGQVIGRVGATGAVTEAHLHFAVKLPGAHARGWTVFPGDDLDPADYLMLDADARQRANAVTHSASAVFVSGLNLPDAEVPVGFIDKMGFGGVRVQASNPDLDLSSLRWLVEQGAAVVALTSASLNKRYATPQDYAAWIAPHIDRLHQVGVHQFELHHIPNTVAGGLGSAWANGAEFGDWFIGLLGRLRAWFNDAEFGFPALSAGRSIRGIRTDSSVFIEQALQAMRATDWVASTAFWQSADEMYLGGGGLSFEAIRQWVPDKPIIITEFGCLSRAEEPIRVATQYRLYWEYLSGIPQIAGAYAFSPPPGVYPNLVWWDEAGGPSILAQALSGRLD